MDSPKRVLVTGGTGSIGAELVRSLSFDGHRVDFQYYTNREAAERLSSATGATGIPLDLSTRFTLNDPSYDVLVNNAGINPSDTKTHLTHSEGWNACIAVNLTACFFLTRLCLPHMLARKWGRIVNISSIYGLVATEGYAPYVASKHGLHGLTKVVAKEYAAEGVSCNQVCPGPLDSELVRRIYERQHPGSDSEALEAHLRQVAEEIPAQRLGTPADVASVVRFLISDAAQYITGASIVMDGGLIA